MSRTKKILIIFGLIWFGAIFYFAGYLVGHKNILFETNYRPKIANRELVKPTTVDFGIFWKAWQIVTDKYVGKIDPQKLVYGAIKGMVEALDDPYSAFLGPQENKSLLEDLSGQIEGIGAELTLKDGKITVVAPLDDSPAEKAGLRPADEILEINSEETANMTLDAAISKIRGPAGTEVKLLISRKDQPVPKEVTIKRDKIVISSVKWEMMGEVGYIKITQFGQDTSDLAKQAAEEIAKSRPKAVILDLRNDPGGYLDAAVDVTSLFVAKDKVVVREQYKDGHQDELKTSLESKLENVKIIVLVNEGSASAAEIVAGALRDLRQAILVGKKTFGKGTVQEVADLDAASYLKITIAQWLTPNGQTIDKQGITPDVEVELSEEDTKADRDPQLDKALELTR